MTDVIARGYSLTFKSPKDDTAELIKYGERKYDHLIMYAPGQKSESWVHRGSARGVRLGSEETGDRR